MDFDIGCQVLTAYGRGNVVDIRDVDSVVVELDEWKLAGGTHPILYTLPSQLQKCSFADIGTCVMTKYGPGVIFNVNRATGLHNVRLWRPRGLGAATAHMNIGDILHTLKAFPGLEVNTIFGAGIVESYSEFPPGRENGKYIVHLSFGLAYLNESAILSCPHAKVLPIAENLADKALSKIKWTEWGESVYSNASKTPVWSSMATFWDRLRSGETKLDEALAERAKQLNEHIATMDLQDMHNQLQSRVDSIVSEPGKIELLLSEGKDRLLQLIESAEKRDELQSSTKSALETYLQTGKEQLDKALDDVRRSSTENELKVIDSITAAKNDLSGSLSVMRNLAQSDPVLQDVIRQIDEVSATVKSKSKHAVDVLSSSRTVQVLETGGKNLSQRLGNLISSSSSDIDIVQGFGQRLKTSLEQQGVADKGKALFDNVRDRITKKISGMDSDKTIAHTIEEKLVSMLSSWKSSSLGVEATSLMTAQLSQLTVLLTMIGEGNMSVDKAISAAQSKIMSTLNNPSFRRSSEEKVREKLTSVLAVVKEGEEKVRGKDISGYKFHHQFLFDDSETSIKETIANAFGDLSKSPEFRGIVDSMKSPLLNDVTQPMSRIVAQLKDGKFNVDEAIQAAKESLDSDVLQTTAAELVARGEKVVTVLESFRSHDAVKTVLTQFQDMDLESTLTSRIMNFDADTALSDAEAALTDTEARNRMLNTTKDKVLGFLLDHIPNMSIPDIQGVKDDVQFAVTKLDLSGFKLKKEDVTVTLGKSINDEFLSCEARNISASFNSVRWKYQQLYFPYLSGNGVADASAQNASIKIGFKLVRVPKGIVAGLAESAAASLEPGYNDGSNVYVRFPGMEAEVERLRSELLVSSRDISNRLQRAGTQLRNGLRGNSSDANLATSSDEATSIWGNDVTAWEPVLIMSSRTITMNSLSLKIDDSSLAWLYNLLASVFTGVIRDYVCTSLKDMLGQQSSSLLGSINSTAVNYWPLIHKILKVDLVVLKEATAADVAALIGPPKPTGGPTEITPREYVMKFAEDGPLGMQLDIFKTGKQVASGSETSPAQTVITGTKVVITGAVANSQAERVFAASGVQPFMQGATIASVNGKTFKGVDEDGVLALLRGQRPLYISVRLSMSGWERLGVHKSLQAKERLAQSALSNSTPTASALSSSTAMPANKRKLRVVSVVFQTGPLGLKLKETKSCGGAVIITGFSESSSGEPLQAEKSGKLSVGMVMLAIEGQVVFGRPFDDVMDVVKAAPRPMKMTFVPSPDSQFTFEAPPTDLVLGRIEGFVMIAAFKSEIGPAQQQGGLSPGMVILQINRQPVNSDATPEDVETMMHAPFSTPPADGKPPRVKLAVRDMDAFMHLIRIRDGLESVTDSVIDISNEAAK